MKFFSRYERMKKNIIKHVLFLPLIFASCASAPVKNINNTEPKIEEKTEVVEENPEETAFIKSLENLNIKLLSAPKFTSVGNLFTSAFTVLVTDLSALPCPSFKITVSYPEKKENGQISYKQENLTCDESGKLVFLPAAPSFACIDKISFYPTPVSEAEAVVKAAKEKTLSADWKVRSDIVKKGAVLFIWEFNELNRPTRNSYDVLSKLKSLGVWNVGNAPVNEPSDITKSLTTLYKENYEIIEDSYGYLIAGTIKFSKPVTALEDGKGYCCSMIADISAVDMKNGNVVLKQTFEQYAEGTNWNNVTQTCKTKISDKITESLVFGL